MKFEEIDEEFGFKDSDVIFSRYDWDDGYEFDYGLTIYEVKKLLSDYYEV